ncbi:uncharacterized protein TNIN_179311 [Trichonephila inaurata madagascariensis]|uniref:Uncharacterized protein n=1 Tax=Trichonephila inaurata madagascariensis TaxID=2747483 RepID=A0A8X6Y976_9ARAC|nr:uncharacterized protein TNIN_179311 [Trichonephila inaurata madagascariensis]
MLSAIYELNVNEQALQLIDSHNLFRKIFNECQEYPSLTPEEQETLTDVYNLQFPAAQESLNDFINRWKNHQLSISMNSCEGTSFEEEESSTICPNMIYDTRKRKHVNPIVIKPLKKSKRKEEFDVYQFITQKEEEGNVYRMDVQSSLENALLDVSYEQKRIDNNLADLSKKNSSQRIMTQVFFK